MTEQDNILTLPVVDNSVEAQIRNAIISAADIKVEDVKWLWDGYLQADRLGLIIGDGGIGKGMLSSWIFAQLSLGALPGIHKDKPVKSLFISTEEHYNSETVPRLMAQGADLKMVSFIDEEKFHIQLDEEGGRSLAKFLAEEGYGIVHVDPIIDFFPPGLSDTEVNVRSVLSPLGRAAKEFGVTIIGLRHVPKGNKNIEDLVLGSKAWRNTARSALGLLRHPDDEKLRVAFNLKMNNGAESSEGLCYVIESLEVPGLQKPIGALKWTGDKFSRSDLEELNGLNSREKEKATGKKAEQDQAVKEYFRENNGKVEPAKGQKDLMSKLGVSQATLYRILDRNNVHRGNKGGLWELDVSGMAPGPTGAEDEGMPGFLRSF